MENIDVEYEITSVGGKLIGSSAWGVASDESDKDYMVPAEGMLQILPILEGSGFKKVQNNIYGTLMRYTNEDLGLDVFCPTEEHQEAVRKASDVMKTLPKEWIKDKTNRVVLFTALSRAFGRDIEYENTFNPSNYVMSIVLK